MSLTLQGEARALRIVLLAGLLLRLGAVAAGIHRPIVGDQSEYDGIAWNLVSGHGYSAGTAETGWRPTATRGPSYVLLLAALYAVFGHHVVVAMVFQALLEAGSIWLVYRISRRLFARGEFAVTAAAMYAGYAPFVLMPAMLLTETLINFLVLVAIWGFLAGGRSGGGRPVLVPGLAIGLGSLSKPVLAPVLGLFFFAGWRPGDTMRGLRTLALQVGVAALVLSPWIVRNAVSFHAFVPTVTGGGITFWGGCGPADGQTLGTPSDPRTPEHVRVAIAGLSEVETDRWLYGEGFRVIRSDPGRYARLLVKKIARLWLNLWFDDPPSRASLILAVVNLSVIALAVVGVRALRPDPTAVRLLLWLALYFTAVHLAYFAVVRYAYPVYAYLFAFAGGGLWMVGARVQGNATAAQPNQGGV